MGQRYRVGSVAQVDVSLDKATNRREDIITGAEIDIALYTPGIIDRITAGRTEDGTGPGMADKKAGVERVRISRAEHERGIARQGSEAFNCAVVEQFLSSDVEPDT